LTPKTDEWIDARGNEEADHAAKSAVHGHPALHLGPLEAETNLVRTALTLIGKSLAMWPKIPKGKKGANRESKQRAEPKRSMEPKLPADELHDWRWAAGKWRCVKCLSICMNEQGRQRRSNERCPGSSSWLKRLLDQPSGHRLLVYPEAKGSIFIVGCSACGKWAQRRPGGLLLPCSGTPTESGAKDLRRLASGKHPERKAGQDLLFLPGLDFRANR